MFFGHSVETAETCDVDSVVHRGVEDIFDAGMRVGFQQRDNPVDSGIRQGADGSIAMRDWMFFLWSWFGFVIQPAAGYP